MIVLSCIVFMLPTAWFQEATAVVKRYQDERLQREEQNWNIQRKKWLKEVKTEVDSIEHEFNKDRGIAFLR